MSSSFDDLLNTGTLESVQEILRARATHEHKDEDYAAYIRLRQTLLQDENIRHRLPYGVDPTVRTTKGPS